MIFHLMVVRYLPHAGFIFNIQSGADTVSDRIKRCSHPVGNWDSVWRQYHVFSFWENPSSKELSCLLEDSECFPMWSLIVILRSWCIASLKGLNYNLKDHLLKVYYCVRFIHTPFLTGTQNIDKTWNGDVVKILLRHCSFSCQ